jgi:uncharacterized protein YbjT (DUF2867 family)
MKIVVIGRGPIGAKLAAALRAQGHEAVAVAAAPDTGVNLLTGEGLAGALAGADVVVDVCDPPSVEQAAALAFFQTATRTLLAAEAAAGVVHHVALSAVGIERLQDSGYFRAKRAQERLIENSSIPYSIVHATQFFEYLPSLADVATDGGAVRLAPVLFQPVAEDDAIAAIGEISAGPPLNGTAEVAGPEQFRMDEFFREALAACDDPRPVRTDPHASFFGAALGEQTLLPGAGAVLGATRYRDWPGRAPARGSALVHELELLVRTELILAETSRPDEAVPVPIEEWLSDPADDQRYEASLRSLLGAVQALEEGSRAEPEGR